MDFRWWKNGRAVDITVECALDSGQFADTALERLIDGSGDDLVGTACRVIRLNVTMIGSTRSACASAR
jgi:hypothetical protein